MKALVIGCGAVGIGLASTLYESNVETDLVARGKTAESIRSNGLQRCGLFGNAVIPSDKIRVFDNAEKAGNGYDYIIVSAKATANESIAQSLLKRQKDILAPHGLIVLCQNGFGTEQAFTDGFDTKQIYHASFAIGFRRPEPNVSEVTVFSKPVSIGSIFGAPAEAAAKLADAIKNGGIPCQITNEIGKTLWAKLLYNCALNPLSAVLGVSYGGLAKNDNSIAIINRIIDEIFAVMHAAGYETYWKDSESYKKDFFEKILPPTYEHRSSTLQDIERKIPTEIDSLNGAVVRMGKKYQIETPYNTMIVQLIKSIESLY